MPKILIILGILIILDITYFAYTNQGSSLTLNYKPFIDSFTLDSGLTYLILGLYGIFGGIILTYSKVLKLENKIKKVAREKEKSSIASEESSDKVKALEAKIKTLEVALKESLKK